MKNGRYKKLVEALEECNIDASLKREVLHTLDDLRNKKRYGLVWNREKVAEDVVLNCRKRMPILESVKEKRIMKEGNSEHNIFIEGDNYHALQVLQQTHQGKIDVIYIDPPYNTGNKDFIYNDKYVDSEDDYRHSKWLSFMEKRLELAKKLLSDTGVIFISIDENEQANLKLLCDEMFGEENFITNFIWRRTKTPPRLSKNVAQIHDYILCYGKNSNLMNLNKMPLKEEYIKKTYKNPDNDQRGPWRLVPLLQPDSSTNKEFTLKMPDGRNITGKWRCSKETFEQYIKDNKLVVSKDGKPNRKRFLSEVDGQIADTWLDDIATNEIGSNEMKDLFGTNSIFSSPKPTPLIKHILKLGTNKNSIILDFFAGSGTTGHAVLELNKEDGGNRQFILCTNNENNNGNGHIAEKVCYPRIKKVIEGYKKNGDGEAVDGLGGGLEYFRTDFVNVNMNAPTDQDRSVVSRKVGYIIGMRHNCFDEVVSESHYQIFANKENKIFIYFEQDLRKFREFQEYMRGETGIMYSYAGESRAQYGIEEEDFQGIEVRKIPDRFFSVYKNCID